MDELSFSLYFCIIFKSIFKTIYQKHEKTILYNICRVFFNGSNGPVATCC